MSPGRINERIILDRLSWIDRMIDEIRSLPIADYDEFSADTRNIWSAESRLRRALEALFDIGRHILAKGFAIGATEYKQTAEDLARNDVLGTEEMNLLRMMGGYRNRLVHFYHEVSTRELYQICRENLDDVIEVRNGITSWMSANPDMIDTEL